MVDLLDSLDKEYRTFFAEAETISDRRKQWEFYRQDTPAVQFVPKLLQFEAQHQRSEVGLMALRRLVLLGVRGMPIGNPGDLGRREALKRLPRYADRPVLTDILRYVVGGNYEPQSRALFRALANDSAADETVREYSRLMLADCMLTTRDYRSSIERRLYEKAEGATSEDLVRRRDLEAELKQYPAASELRRWEAEAVLLLQEIAKTPTTRRWPAVQRVDLKGYIIRIDENRTKEWPLISSLAEGMLFKETHLREGKRAAELNVKLISGQDWSLAAQAGRVTVIQFSFKGCGPCEAMYPDLREIQRAYGDRVSILSIMADERIEDTREAVSSGKMTWNVHWDGFRGPLATRWAVDSFPAVYVVDEHGLVAAARNVRGEKLKNLVASLLK